MSNQDCAQGGRGDNIGYAKGVIKCFLRALPGWDVGPGGNLQELSEIFSRCAHHLASLEEVWTEVFPHLPH